MSHRWIFEIGPEAMAAIDGRGTRVRGFELGGAPLHHAAHGDQAAVLVGSPEGGRLALVQVDQGEVLWTAPLSFTEGEIALAPGRIAVALATLEQEGQRVGQPGPSTLEVRDATSGSTLWTRGLPGSIALHAADVQGFLVSCEDGVRNVGRDTAAEIVFEPRWALVSARADFEHVLVASPQGVDSSSAPRGRPSGARRSIRSSGATACSRESTYGPSPSPSRTSWR